MVQIDTLLAFVLAATVILLVPGPTVMLVISQSISNGSRAAMPLIAGVALGDLIAITVSVLGLGAVLATSATAFALFKWAGAGYLIYLGVSMWRREEVLAGSPLPEVPAGALFRQAMIVTALNPKSIIFFVAFVPQFIQADRPMGVQLLVLGGSFLLLSVLSVALYSHFAVGLRGLMRAPIGQRLIHRAGGTTLIGAGLIAATNAD